MNAAIGAVALLQLLMLAAMIWQGVHLLVTNRRIKRNHAMLTAHRRALTSMYVQGMISDADWERATTPLPKRRRTTITIEPVRGPVTGRDYYQRWPKPPVGGAGNSGAR